MTRPCPRCGVEIAVRTLTAPTNVRVRITDLSAYRKHVGACARATEAARAYWRAHRRWPTWRVS